jgi:phosphoribosylaminoimidazole-succinocarboxamide synthase
MRLDVEAIARGYITGSAWAEYTENGHVCGVEMPTGLIESQAFDEPIFTPTTKAEIGHDENMSREQLADLVGEDYAEEIKRRTLQVYTYAAGYARERGIIIADTKFEFGIVDDELIVIDEMLTPDSSRFWPADQYQAGRSQPSFDKQFVRDYLSKELKWNREPPPPQLPSKVILETAIKYQEGFERLVGRKFAA